MTTKRFLLDGHADILYRMDQEQLDFYDPQSALQENFAYMQAGGLDMQIFALFVAPPTTPDQQLRKIVKYIDTFKRRICDGVHMAPVYRFSDIESNYKIGLRSGLLSIEGGDCLDGDIGVLRIMYDLGVRAMGLTWNTSNSIADGAGAEVDHGLTDFGREVIREMNRLGMVVDVSHLPPKGFWDVVGISTAPIIASHSNAKAILPHRRNLDDDQIKAIIGTGGVIGMTFVPYFISDQDSVSIDDLIRHIDHILSLGGENHIGIGSDFDGITKTMIDLENGSHFPKLIAALDVRYGWDVTAKIMSGNLLRVFEQILK